MDPLSITMAVVGLAEAGAKVLDVLHKYISSVSDATSRVKAIYDETEATIHVVNELERMIEDNTYENTFSASAKCVAIKAIEKYHDVFHEIMELLRKVRIWNSRRTARQAR